MWAQMKRFYFWYISSLSLNNISLGPVIRDDVIKMPHLFPFCVTNTLYYTGVTVLSQMLMCVHVYVRVITLFVCKLYHTVSGYEQIVLQ